MLHKILKYTGFIFIMFTLSACQDEEVKQITNPILDEVIITSEFIEFDDSEYVDPNLVVRGGEYYVGKAIPLHIEYIIQNPDNLKISEAFLNGVLYDENTIVQTDDGFMITLYSGTKHGEQRFKLDYISVDVDGTNKQIIMTDTTWFNVYKTSPTFDVEFDYGYTDVSWNVTITDPDQAVVEELKIALYKDGTVVSETNELNGDFEALYSNQQYTLKVFAGVNVGSAAKTKEVLVFEEEFTTDAFIVTGDINEIDAQTDRLSIEFLIEDEYGLIALEDIFIDLYKGNTFVGSQTPNQQSGVVEFIGLLSDQTYKLKVRTGVDFLDGTGYKEIILDEIEVETLSYSIDSVLFSIGDIDIDQEQISFDVNIVDEDGLLMGEGILVGAFLDGTLVETKTALFSQPRVTFEDLLSGVEYTFGFGAIYDLRDGTSFKEHSFGQVNLSTLSKLPIEATFEILSIGLDTFTFDYLISDPDTTIDQNLSTISLILGEDEHMIDFDPYLHQSIVVSDLFTNQNYQFKAYLVYDLNDGNGPQVYEHTQTIQTLIASEPSVDVVDVDVHKNSIEVFVDVVNPDEVWMSDILVRLYQDDIIASETVYHQGGILFDGLFSNQEYSIELHYNYNLNDQTGIKAVELLLDTVTTLSNQIPTAELTIIESQENSVAFNYVVLDEDNIIKADSLMLTLYDELDTIIYQEALTLFIENEMWFDELQYDMPYRLAIIATIDDQSTSGEMELVLSEAWFDLGDTPLQCFTSLGGEILSYDESCGAFVDIPNYHGGALVTMIAPDAFNGFDLLEVDLPDLLEEIGQDAFKDNKLSFITIPETVHTIHSGAFDNNRITSFTVLGVFNRFDTLLSNIGIIPLTLIDLLITSDNSFIVKDVEDYAYNPIVDYKTLNPVLRYSGEVNNLILHFKLSDLVDYDFDYNKAELEYNLNESPTSLKNYYQNLSLGAFTYNSIVAGQGDELGVFVSENDFWYYTDNANPYLSDYNFKKLLLDVLDWNIEQGYVDPTIDYDMDDDGFYDAISFVVLNDTTVYNGIAFSFPMWPHKSDFGASLSQGDGLQIGQYQLLVSVNHVFDYSTVIHESIHNIAPVKDLYMPYDYGVPGGAVGTWDIMGNTTDNMMTVGYIANEYLGYMPIVNEIKESGTFTVEPLYKDGNDLYRIPISDDEYIYIEYRSNEFEMNSITNGEGLLLYRVFDNGGLGNLGGSYYLDEFDNYILDQLRYEVFVYRPIPGFSEPYRFYKSSDPGYVAGSWGDITKATLSLTNDYSVAGYNTDFPLFGGDGNELPITIEVLSEVDGELTFSVTFENGYEPVTPKPLISLYSELDNIGDDVILLDSDVMSYLVQIEMDEIFTNGTIYYTLDGSEPTVSSAVYSGPFEIDALNHIVKAIYVDGVTSETSTKEFTFIGLGNTQVSTPIYINLEDTYTSFDFTFTSDFTSYEDKYLFNYWNVFMDEYGSFYDIRNFGKDGSYFLIESLYTTKVIQESYNELFNVGGDNMISTITILGDEAILIASELDIDSNYQFDYYIDTSTLTPYE